MQKLDGYDRVTIMKPDGKKASYNAAEFDVYVTDNGVVVDMAKHTRVFFPWHRVWEVASSREISY